MLAVPPALVRRYEARLYQQNLMAGRRPHSHKWLRYYLDFCHKYSHAPEERASLPAFLEKLRTKQQPESLRQQAKHAVVLYWESTKPPSGPRTEAADREHNTMESAGLKLTGASWIWVYDGLTSAIKVRHYSPKTLQAYKIWTRKFQAFTRSKDPRLVSMDDVKGFLSFLAVTKKVAASSQNQAFNALLFLFRHVLGKDFGKVEGVVRAKRKPYIPVVLSREEVDRIIARLDAPYALVVKLLYGCGLRLFECLQLRVQDLNLAMMVLTRHVPFATASPAICCRRTTTFARFRSCWDTATYARR